MIKQLELYLEIRKDAYELVFSLLEKEKRSIPETLFLLSSAINSLIEKMLENELERKGE